MPATSRRRRCDSTKSTRDGSSFLLEKRKEPKENRQRVQSGLRCRGSNDGSKRGTDVCTGGMNGARRFRSRKKGTVKRKEPKENRQRGQSGLRCRGSNDGSKRGTDVCTGGMNRARRFRSQKKGTERKPSAGAKRLSLPWYKRRLHTGSHRLHGWNERCAALSVSKERNRKKTVCGSKRFSICAFHTKTVSPERPLRAAPRRAAATVG